MYGLDSCRFQNLAFDIKPTSPYAPFLSAIRARFAESRLLLAPDRVRDLINRVIVELYRAHEATTLGYLDTHYAAPHSIEEIATRTNIRKRASAQPAEAQFLFS